MKIAAKDFKDTLGIINRWVPSRPIVEASGGYFISRRGDDSISIAATDMSVSDIVMYVGISDVEDFEPFVVRARQLNSTISSMSKIGQDINLELSGSQLTMQCGHHETSLQTMLADEFPTIRELPECATFSANPIELHTSISIVKAAAIINNPRRSLAGIYFKDGDVVSADGFRLIIVRDIPFTETPVIVPAEFCHRLGYLLPNIADNGVNVYHSVDSGHIFLEWGAGITSSSLVALDFPDYTMMIPKSYSTKVVMYKSDLKIALDLAAPFAEDTNNLIVMTAVKGMVLLEAASTIGSNSSTVEPITLSGSSVKIGISCKFLKDAVGYMPDEVEFMMNGPGDIIMVSDGESLLYGIMPMAVSE
jgi:DNA polymerase-3 subunit beta